MNSLIVATNVVFPLIVLIAVGYMAGAFRWISNESFSQFNKLVFNILLPCVLFENVYNVSLDEILNLKLIIFGLCSVFAVFLACIPVSGLVTREPSKRGVILMGSFRSNVVLYGFPIVQSMYARELLAPVSVLIAVIVPVFNVLGVISLEMFRSGKISVNKILLNIVKNPMIIGTAAGILCSVSGFDMPQILRGSLSNITAAATPVALIILGGTFKRQTVGDNRKYLIAISSLRLLIVPAVFLCIAIPLGFRNVELLALVALLGSPAAVSSYSMARQMGADSELAGQNLLFTTVFSIPTIFLWVSLLNHFGYIV